jgi:DNA polymerase III subunit chi
MTEVKFFFNVDHKLQFACKLAARAYSEGKKLVVYSADARRAEEFDRLLWAYAQLSFVPHVRAEHALAGETPIVIAVNDESLPHHEALLNLDDAPPPFFSRFEQLREVVSTDDEDRHHARERVRFYKARGFDIQNIDMKSTAAASTSGS